MAKKSDEALGSLMAVQESMSISVPAERRKENARYIVHSVKLSAFGKIDRTDAEQVRARTIEYLEACVNDGMKPNLTGYALALGTNRQGLQQMFLSRNMDHATLDALDSGVAMIENVMLELMLDQKINPVTAIFLLKNHFAYSDQTNIKIQAERVDTVDEQALEDKYRTVIEEQAATYDEDESDTAALRALQSDISEHYKEPGRG